ncbi:MAG: hypothetical protein ABSH56_16095 [Bryobacteraceae bacterium]|jgi:hypothetical protein
MKYGAYKSLEGTEMSRPNAQYNPGEQAPRANPNLNVLVPGAAPVCLYCGNSWGDHKINETDEVHNLALQIGGPLPAGLNLGANRMIGVLKVILHGGAPHYFCAVSGGGAGQAALDGALAAGLAAAPGMNHIHVALSLPAGFALRDFGGAVIANWAAVVNNAAAVQEARNAIDTPDDLTCAAPKLLQRAFEHFSVPANQLVGATMYLSEVSFLAATHAKYSPQHSAASCNKCRLSCWRFLCGYTNNHKKAQNPRPVGHQSMTALVGAARLL